MRRKFYFLWILLFTFDTIITHRVFAEETRLYHAQGKRDAFVPLVALTMRQSASGLISVESVDEVQIEGVVMDANPRQSIVIANGSVLKEGEEVGSVKVLKIKPEGAVFSVNGIEAYKPLYQEEVKK